MSLRNLGLYHHWAGNKSRKILRELSEEEFNQNCGEILGTVRQKVEHIVFALITCYSHLNVKLSFMEDSLQETYQKVAGYTTEQLLDCWENLDKQLKEGLSNDLRGTVEIQRRDRGSFCLMLNDHYLQYIFHTIYHRGQLNYSLKFLDKPRINADYLFYIDELDTSLEER